MSARVHKIGTIYSRLHGLISKGVIRPQDKPLWFDIYSHFPPKYEPSYDRKAPKMEIREIFYEEDEGRAKIHAKFSDKLGIINLTSSEETNSQKWIKSYRNYIAEGMSLDEALDKIAKNIEGNVHEKTK